MHAVPADARLQGGELLRWRKSRLGRSLALPLRGWRATPRLNARQRVSCTAWRNSIWFRGTGQKYLREQADDDLENDLEDDLEDELQ